MNTFTEPGLQVLVDSTFVDRFELFETIESTNDRAKALARDTPTGVTLIVANRQVAGRGRGSNRWLSGEGSLTFSLLLPPGFQLPEPAGTVSLWSAIAICGAVSRFVPREKCGVKWPNDVMIQRRKVGGLLLESVNDSLVVGVGLNVATDLQPHSLPEATSMSEQARSSGAANEPLQLSLANVLVACVDTWERTIENAGSHRLPTRWRELDVLAGTPVTVKTATDQISGMAIGIDEHGSLLVETPSGIRTMATGTVDW